MTSKFSRKETAPFRMPSFLFTPNQLTLFSGPPTINALLVHYLANCKGLFFCGNSFAYIDIVNAFAEPDAHISMAAQPMVQQRTDFFRCAAGDPGNTDLPAGLVFYDLTITQSQALVVLQIADGADVNATIGGILHNIPFPVFKSFPSLCLHPYYNTYTQKVNHNFL